MKNFLTIVLVGLIIIILFSPDILRIQSSPKSTHPFMSISIPTVTCHELISQGGFEMGLLGWNLLNPTLSTDSGPEYVSYPISPNIENNTLSVQLGIDRHIGRPFTNGIYQKIVLPESAETIVLSLYYMPVHTASLDKDFQFINISDASTNQPLELLWKGLNNQDYWSQKEFDITHLKGRYVRMEFGVFNDGVNGTTLLFLDQVSLTACGTNLMISNIENQVPTALPTPYILPTPNTVTEIEPTPTPAIASLPRIAIVEIVNQQSHHYDHDEYIVLLNVFEELDLNGWSLSNGLGDVFMFPELTFKSKSIIKVHISEGTDSQTDLYWYKEESIWGEENENKIILKNLYGSVIDVYDLSIHKRSPPGFDRRF